MIWPTIIFNNTKEEIPKGYIKHGNRLSKLYDPYINGELPNIPKQQTIMKNTEQPITPSPELRRQWQSESPFKIISVEREDYMIDRAAKWGADQELVACCDWLDTHSLHLTGSQLRAYRRPKPPTLKEKAFESLEKIQNNEATYLDAEIIKDALRKLPNDC